MPERTEITEMVISAVDEYLSDLRGSDSSIDMVSVDETTRLFGSKGVLDSLGVVILLTELEERLEDKFDISVSLANDSTMSSSRSPFRTVASLVDYVFRVLEVSEG
jgi:acyl carrier protein